MVHLTAVTWTSRGGKLAYIQDTIEPMTGWTPGEILARPSLGIIPPPDQTASPGLAHPSIHIGKTKIACKDGTAIAICTCAITLNGEVTVGMFRRACPHLEQLAGLWDRLAEKNKIRLLDLASILAR